MRRTLWFELYIFHVVWIPWTIIIFSILRKNFSSFKDSENFLKVRNTEQKKKGKIILSASAYYVIFVILYIYIFFHPHTIKSNSFNSLNLQWFLAFFKLMHFNVFQSRTHCSKVHCKLVYFQSLSSILEINWGF